MFSIYFFELERSFVFKGRTSRKSFWLFAIVHTIVLLSIIGLIVLTNYLAEADGGSESIFSTIMIILSLFLIILYIFPTTSITTRRFHDINLSGWHQLYGFIPYIGSLIVFAYMCYKSVDENNRYNITNENRINIGDINN